MYRKETEELRRNSELREVRVMTAETAAVNDRRNTAPEFPMYECPQSAGQLEFPYPRRPPPFTWRRAYARAIAGETVKLMLY